jgi:hypothetical protein
VYVAFELPQLDSECGELGLQRPHVRGARRVREGPIDVRSRLVVVECEKARALGTRQLRIHEYELWADWFRHADR